MQQQNLENCGQEMLDAILSDVFDFCGCTGSVMKYEQTYKSISMALTPYQYDRQAFNQVYKVQTYFNTLIDKVARNTEYLMKHLEKVAQNDDFIQKLLDLSKQVHSEGLKQTVYLGIFRNDFMLHEDNKLQQVEINTISSGLLAISVQNYDLLRYMKFKYPQIWTHNQSDIYKNESYQKCVEGMYLAHKHYLECYKSNNGYQDAIVFVIQPNEKNIGDQRLIELMLWKQYNVKVYRKTLTQMNKCKLDENGRLILQVLYFRENEQVEVTVVYYRAGYTPNDYPTQEEWDARLKVERSLAIKCPSVDYQLAGSKKFQEVWSHPGELELFFNTEISNLLRSYFTEYIGLEINTYDPKILEEVKKNNED